MSTAELRDAGLSPRGIADRVRRGRLFVVWRGAYSVGHEPLTDEAFFRAAEVALDADVSHRSAAALWGFRKRRPGEAVEVTVAGRCVRSRQGLVVHRTRTRDPHWTRLRGIRVTSAVQTLLDCDELENYFERERVAIEVDSREFHDNPITRADDHAKQQRATHAGIRLLRVRWKDITINHRKTATRIRTALEEQFEGPSGGEEPHPKLTRNPSS